jgi:hypothetical protein
MSFIGMVSAVLLFESSVMPFFCGACGPGQRLQEVSRLDEQLHFGTTHVSWDMYF